MIQINSNVDEVLAWIAGSVKGVNEASNSVILPGQYIPALMDVAEKVLDGMTEASEKAAIPGVLNSLHHYLSQRTVSFELTAISEASVAALSAGEFSFGDLMPLEEDIADWVAQFKEKDERDQYKGTRGMHNPGDAVPDNIIARRIIGTITEGTSSWLSSENETGLLAYLKENAPEKLNHVFGLTPLDSTRLSSLLDHVLAAWDKVMGVKVVDVALAGIDKALPPTAA